MSKNLALAILTKIQSLTNPDYQRGFTKQGGRGRGLMTTVIKTTVTTMKTKMVMIMIA